MFLEDVLEKVVLVSIESESKSTYFMLIYLIWSKVIVALWGEVKLLPVFFFIMLDFEIRMPEMEQ